MVWAEEAAVEVVQEDPTVAIRGLAAEIMVVAAAVVAAAAVLQQ